MRKALWASAIAMSVAIGSASSAQAAPFFSYDPNISLDFGNSNQPARASTHPTFNDTFTTTKSLLGLVTFSSFNGKAPSSQTHLRFVTATINGTDILITITPLGNNNERRDGSLFDFRLPPGLQTLVFSGDVARSGSYSGQVSLTAVPEASTWAMMIGGFGMIGGAMRRKTLATRKADLA